MYMKGAIFDMDGTVLDSMGIWEGIMGELLEQRGVIAPANLLEEIEHLTLTKKIEYVGNQYAPDVPIPTLLHELQSLVLKKYREVVLPKPGIVAYLKHLRSKGIPTCVATLTDRRFAMPALKHHGLDKLFDFLLTVEEVGKSKEFPDIYITGAQRMGVEAKDCVVFEDSLYAMKTAKRAGFQLCGVYDDVFLEDREEITQLCDCCTDDFNELIESKSLA